MSTFLVLAWCLADPGRADAQQLDLSGEWNTIYHEDGPHRGAGPELGDCGIPVNDAGRLKAESWDASSLSLRERQCIPHISSYALRGPATIRLWKTNDPLSGQATAYQMLGSNNEAIQLMHAPAAHTDGDSLIFFRKSDVISAGDVFITTGYPVIDTKRGGSVTGVIDALNRIIEVAVSKDWQEGGTMIVPGHGRPGDEADVVEYRDMVTIVFERVQEMVKKGMTLAQVKAARPTLDYDGRYGASIGRWTTDMLIEAVFQDVSRRAPSSR